MQAALAGNASKPGRGATFEAHVVLAVRSLSGGDL